MVEPEYEYEVKPAGSQDINNSLMCQGDMPDSNLNDKIGDKTFIILADTDVDPKKGNHIEFVMKDSTDNITGTIVGRAGKVSGKNGQSYNVTFAG